MGEKDEETVLRKHRGSFQPNRWTDLSTEPPMDRHTVAYDGEHLMPDLVFRHIFSTIVK